MPKFLFSLSFIILSIVNCGKNSHDNRTSSLNTLNKENNNAVKIAGPSFSVAIDATVRANSKVNIHLNDNVPVPSYSVVAISYSNAVNKNALCFYPGGWEVIKFNTQNNLTWDVPDRYGKYYVVINKNNTNGTPQCSGAKALAMQLGINCNISIPECANGYKEVTITNSIDFSDFNVVSTHPNLFPDTLPNRSTNSGKGFIASELGNDLNFKKQFWAYSYPIAGTSRLAIGYSPYGIHPPQISEQWQKMNPKEAKVYKAGPLSFFDLNKNMGINWPGISITADSKYRGVTQYAEARDSASNQIISSGLGYVANEVYDWGGVVGSKERKQFCDTYFILANNLSNAAYKICLSSPKVAFIMQKYNDNKNGLSKMLGCENVIYAWGNSCASNVASCQRNGELLFSQYFSLPPRNGIGIDNSIWEQCQKLLTDGVEKKLRTYSGWYCDGVCNSDAYFHYDAGNPL